ADPEIAGMVLARYRQLDPRIRSASIDVLLSREAWTAALLQSARSNRDLSGQVDAARRTRLLSHKNAEIASLVRAVFGSGTAGNATTIQATLEAAAKLSGDARRGDAVFTRQCATCHKLGGRGHEVGPDLSAAQFADPKALLAQVLDPNRFVAPN